MRKLLLGSAFALATMTVSPVLAADIDFAPVSDWTGIYGKEHAVGRGEDCDLQIPDHSVSRRHVQIDRTERGYSISDLQSTNGTFVNDQPAAATPLHDGDYVRIGNNIFRFLSGGNVEAEYHEEIYRLTIMDGLTQIHNQRYLLDFLDREIARPIGINGRWPWSSSTSIISK